jgi:hypothetical protein
MDPGLGTVAGLCQYLINYFENKVFSFWSTSKIVLSGNVHINSALRIRQSKLFIWSDRIAPAAGNPAGMQTSNGYPLTWLVIGHRIASPVLPL